MNSLKLAALTIASLKPGDRRWIWKCLSHAERRALRPHVRQALKLQAGRITGVMTDLGLAAGDSPETEAGVIAASGDRVTSVVAGMPMGCLALALAHLDRQARDQYLRALPVFDRDRLISAAAVARKRVTPAFVSLLITQINKSLAGEAERQPVSSFERLLNGLPRSSDLKQRPWAG